ncbi:EAL domain-containing protein [Pseudodesulfovibrio sp. F-1]|uniref:EAL domain-containing protein n=1 Tax=Pseudodesulfovibrio alkaliphilus TaxID=2661613 RepID=A0A7K1KRA1_9BACT|nr:EAL domain-containing protein [Pseudodesulfovibrio alkaliphilus]MUM78442.1 EAL domain-containing protein [Pseudodesulfovibrio alkaliphilus]
MNGEVEILVVDDDRINLKLIQGILRGQDMRVITAMSGDEALSKAAGSNPAVALLDVMMPGMDGFELAERLRASERTRTVPIIFITAISKERRNIFRGYELGAVDYLFKPVEPEILRGKVGIFAELHRKNLSLEAATRRLEKVVAELESSQSALRESEQRYRMVADYIHDWESWFGPDGEAIYISPSCERITGYSPARFVEEPELIQRIVHPDDFAAWHNYMTGSSFAEEGIDYRINHRDARIRWVSMVRHTVEDDTGKPLGVRLSVRDVTSRKHMEQRLKHSSLHDPLTGLPNRALLFDRVGQAAERSVRTNEYFAVLFINLDRFQVVNDHFGHMVGDRILVEIGVRLRRIVRPVDTVARFGGDDFVIIFEEMRRKLDVRDMVRLVRESFVEPFEIDSVEFPVTASMGIEMVKGYGEAPDKIVHNAQLAMYKAKGAGKNRCVTYEAGMREGAASVLAMESELKRALRAREFEAHFQPIVTLADGQLYGFEALARWRHPERGLVSPGEFIPLAEETGLIVELGEQILEDACRTLNQWRTVYPAAAELIISVNISARQFGEAGLVDMVKRILDRTGLPANLLKLEITETVVMLDAMESSTRLNLLKSLGIMLSIDDFGTGYSSMSYLQKFPMDQLKIDLSFVRLLEKGPENIEIIRAIVNMAHSLRLRVVAEGIESERQRDLLYSLQCDYGQGYLYARPLPGSEAEAFLASGE